MRIELNMRAGAEGCGDRRNGFRGAGWKALRATLMSRLARHSAGRVVLHLACLVRDGKWRWHWAGVLRELRPA